MIVIETGDDPPIGFHRLEFAVPKNQNRLGGKSGFLQFSRDNRQRVDHGVTKTIGTTLPPVIVGECIFSRARESAATIAPLFRANGAKTSGARAELKLPRNLDKRSPRGVADFAGRT